MQSIGLCQVFRGHENGLHCVLGLYKSVGLEDEQYDMCENLVVQWPDNKWSRSISFGQSNLGHANRRDGGDRHCT